MNNMQILAKYLTKIIRKEIEYELLTKKYKLIAEPYLNELNELIYNVLDNNLIQYIQDLFQLFTYRYNGLFLQRLYFNKYYKINEFPQIFFNFSYSNFYYNYYSSIDFNKIIEQEYFKLNFQKISDEFDEKNNFAIDLCIEAYLKEIKEIYDIFLKDYETRLKLFEIENLNIINQKIKSIEENITDLYEGPYGRVYFQALEDFKENLSEK